MLRYSQFNLVDTIDEKYCSLYNTRSTKHLILNLDEIFLTVADLSSDDKITFLPIKIRDQFLAQGFIFDSTINEIDALRRDSRRKLAKLNSCLYLTILPTLNCNFCCSYCYEDLDNSEATQYIQTTTKNNLLEFVETKFEQGIQSGLFVKWFGGEPLLAKEHIVDLSQRLQNLAAKYQVKYSSVMVTNGYLLDQLTFSEISALALETIQVTLDGPEQVHNLRRPTKSWEGSYARIVANLEVLVKFYSGLVLRINIDKNSTPYVHELFIELEQRGILYRCKSVKFAYVDTQIGRYAKAINCAKSYAATDVCDAHETITTNLKKIGLVHFAPIAYPRVIPAACDAHLCNYYVIDPNGYVFKCLGDVTTPQHAIYNLSTKEKINSTREQQLLHADISMHERCSVCAMLPICHSGCTAKYLDLKTQEPFCRTFCHTLHQQLVELARRNLQ